MNNKNKKSISLKAYLWIYFGIFAVIIMLVLWVLQTFFLSAFYNTMKLDELEKAGHIISEQYDLNDEDFYTFWFEHSFNSGIFAQLVTENGDIVRNFENVPISDRKSEYEEYKKFENIKQNPPDTMGHDTGKSDNGPHFPHKNHFGNRGFMSSEDFEDFLEQTKREGKISYIVESQGDRGAYGIYGKYLGDLDGQKIYLCLISPLERTDTTRKVLQTQLIIASLLAVVLALIIAYFIAKRFSKPVERITKGAKKLAEGDYEVKFNKGAYREIDELADTLNYATGELSKTEELRRDLISNVSHDLRTPLTIIKSYAELIRDISGKNDEKRTIHSNVIIEETNTLSQLVSDMLDLSKIQSGTLPMDMKPFSMKDLVEQTLKRFDYYSENHGIVFEVQCNTNGQTVGDERKIEQVIYNLVANAINYTGEDKVVCVKLDENENAVRFSVTDTGCGIKEEEIDLVWDKYYKSSDNHKREKIGSGIGLSIVKNILLAHNARFGVESEVGEGSTFWFELNKSI